MNQRLEHQQQLQAESGLQSATTPRRDFNTPEELIQADRGQVQVPESVAGRLASSVESSPAPAPRPWWKRLLGGG